MATSLAERLKSFYGFKGDEAEEMKMHSSGLSFLKDPFSSFKGLEQAVELVKKHIEKGNRIAVFGDYDVDGMTSTAIVVGALKKKGADVGFYIPSRYKDGYGANESIIGQFAEKKYKLLITVDNGISAFQAIIKAKDLGMDVLVIDHHKIEGTLPPADCILHNGLAHYSDQEISAAFVSLVFSYGLLGFFDEYFACLAGLAVFSDSMPMFGMNRCLASFCQYHLLNGSYKNFISLLGRKKGFLTSHEIIYNINSPLNGLGRVNIGNRNNNGVRFLLAFDDCREADQYADFIKKVAMEKKQTYKEKIVALEEIYAASPDKDRGVFVSYTQDADIGLTGALASALSQSVRKPVILLGPAPNDPSLIIASGRAPDGFDLFSLLEPFAPSFLAYGGHKQALGFTIKKEDYQPLKEKIEGIKEFGQTPKYQVIALALDEVNLSTMAEIRAYEPFGNGFMNPVFALNGDRLDLKRTRDNKHLMARLPNGSSIVWFNAPCLVSPAGLLLQGNLEENEFMGQKKADFVVEKACRMDEVTIIE